MVAICLGTGDILAALIPSMRASMVDPAASVRAQ
jgi:hypothetical protein